MMNIPDLEYSVRTAHYFPAYLHLFTGPMKSGKTEGMIYHLDRSSYSHLSKFQLFKPCNDDRSDANTVFSRKYGTIPCQPIDPAHPEDILAYIGKDVTLIGIDEAQFFAPQLSDVVSALRKSRRHVLCAFLDTDFRGEPFPTSQRLLFSYPDKIDHLTAVCEVQPCEYDATMTQRLVNGLPAHYDDPVELIEKPGRKETYEARCIFHHAVDRNPR